MPVPLILGAAALLAGGIGIKKGLDAKEDFDRAERIGESAKRRHESAVRDLESAKNLTNEKLIDLGKLKVDIFQNQIKFLVAIPAPAINTQFKYINFNQVQVPKLEPPQVLEPMLMTKHSL